MNEALAAWRSREGTALLVYYGALIAAVSATFAYVTAPAHVYTPLWVRVLPIGLPVVLIALVLLVRPLRAYAYRLQLLNVGVFLFVLVGVLLGEHDSPSTLLAVVIAMFGVQYAFMRWQELLCAYAGAFTFYAALAAYHGIALRAPTLYSLETLLVVGFVCVALGSLRLRSMYEAAIERFELEAQTAELRRQTERSARMAFTDALTGLLNRAGMNDLIDRALALSNANGSKTAVLYMDLDGFKKINDVCGHDAGDLALVEAALRIQYLLRTGETAGRIGGDEFVIVLPSVHSVEEANALAKRIEDAFADPFHAAGTPFSLSASIGIALSRHDGRTRLELLSAADKAMYMAKRARKMHRRFSPAPRRSQV